jgi:hypothetical protein
MMADRSGLRLVGFIFASVTFAVMLTYQAWDRDHLILDTAEGSIDSLIERVLQHIANALRL